MSTQPRPPSCLPCRLKKLKCDRKTPCTRCIKTSGNHCVYPRKGTLGRPPKNTVFLGKSKNNGLNQLMIREFIFEQGTEPTSNNTALVAANKAIDIPGFFAITEWWILSKEAVKDYPFLNTYFKAIDKLYSERGLAIRKRFGQDSSRLIEKPRIKFNNLKLNYTWWTCMTVDLLIKRASRLQLETHSLPLLTLYILQTDDSDNNVQQNGDNNYFDRQHEHGLIFSIPETIALKPQPTTPNPTRSLTPDQAIDLINDFFLVHPHSILINKTKLVNEYWSDTANPLLLSVIYGTTLCFTKNLQGIPLYLWESGTEANRNPFLSYAHFLLETLPSSPSASDYQATVILALFELVWGYSKLGMSLLATTYVMGTKLGLWDKSFDSDDPIDVELVNMTFWAVFRTTTYGSMELGASLVDSLVYHEHLFPPMNMHESRSYQYDSLHDNTTETSYLIESFYSGAVVTFFSGIIYACLPKAYYTMYGLKTDDDTFKGSELLTKLRSIEDVETRIYTVLDDFDRFIQQHRDRWTAIQLYTIVTTLKLYTIHFRFLQPNLASGRRKHQEEPISLARGIILSGNPLTYFDLDLTDLDIVTRLNHVLDDVISTVDDLETILIAHSNNNESKPTNSAAYLPHDIMITAFETATQLLMLIYQLNPSNQLYDTTKRLISLYDLLDPHIIPSASLKNVRQQLKSFLKRHDPIAMTWRRSRNTASEGENQPTELETHGIPLTTLPTRLGPNQRFTYIPPPPSFALNPFMLPLPSFIDPYSLNNPMLTTMETIRTSNHPPLATRWEEFSLIEWNSWMVPFYDGLVSSLDQDPLV